MEKNFQKNEIIGITSDLRRSGKSWREVAEHLLRNGYTNMRGLPYSEGGIWTLYTLATDPEYRTRVTRPVKTQLLKTQPVRKFTSPTKKVLANTTSAVVDLRKSIINLQGVDAGDKLSLLEKTYEL